MPFTLRVCSDIISIIGRFVVKSGINFGMDYCIYRDSPDKVHSEMCIRVVDAISTPKIIANEYYEQELRQLPYRSYMASCKLQSPTSSDRKVTMENLTEQSEHVAGDYYYDHMSWKALSTITRVMPVSILPLLLFLFNFSIILS